MAGSTAANCPASPIPRRTRRVAQRVDPGDLQAPRVRAQQGGHCPDEGGLAGAVGPQQGHDSAVLGHQVQPGQGLGAAETLGEAAGLKARGHVTGVLS